MLARRAASIAKRESVGSWLYGVACRVASASRASSARRKAAERSACLQRGSTAGAETRHDSDVLDASVIDEEVARLPERLRAVFMLCCMEGLTYEEVARRLGWPVGTVKSRLARGRARLRQRLVRRGLGPTAVGFATRPVTKLLPPHLVGVTARAAAQFCTENMAAGGGPSAAAVALTREIFKAMILKKLTLVGTVVAASALVAAGAAGFAPGASAGAGQQPAQEAPPIPSVCPVTSKQGCIACHTTSPTRGVKYSRLFPGRSHEAPTTTAADPNQTDDMFGATMRVNTAAVTFARLGEVREGLEKVYKQLEELSRNPTDREAARQLRATLLSAEDGLRVIRSNVDRIAVEPRPVTKPKAPTPPRPVAGAKSDDLERRLRDVERKLDELLGARGKPN